MRKDEILLLLSSKTDELKSDFSRFEEKIESWRKSDSETLARIREDISALKIKAGAWGAVGGVLAALSIVAGEILKKILGG